MDGENRAALLAELMAFEGTPLPNGMTRFAAALGGHDDLVIAMMLAWTAAHRPKGGWIGTGDPGQEVGLRDALLGNFRLAICLIRRITGPSSSVADWPVNCRLAG